MIVKTLKVKNLRNVIDVSFEFDNKLVKISGNNGAGKSTIVDAIFLAIVGKTYIGKGRNAENLVKKGESLAEIEVVLEGNGKKLKIHRIITERGNVNLEIRESEGNKLQQRDLDLLLSEFTIDPLEFSKKSKKEQYEIIKTLAGVDTSDTEIKIAIQEQKTQDLRAVYTEEKKSLDNLGKVDPIERVDITKLSVEITKNTEHNYEINKNKDDKKRSEIKIEELEKELESEKQRLNGRTQKQKELGDIKPIVELQDKLEKAQEVNVKALEREQYQTLFNKHNETKAYFTIGKENLEKLRSEKKELIKKAKLPIKDMEFSETEGVVIDGIPFDQHSSAEQLIIACKIATSSNPGLKVVYIKDGSLLDEKNMKQIDKFAKTKGYQFFCEIVGENEVNSILMRDGEVVVEKIK